MTQTNEGTSKSRAIRAPHGWKAPSKQLVPQGKTVCLTIRPGQPGKSIRVNHPDAAGMQFVVNVPRKAKVGRKMLVPCPTSAELCVAKAHTAEAAATVVVMPSRIRRRNPVGTPEQRSLPALPLSASVPRVVLLVSTQQNMAWRRRGRCSQAGRLMRLTPSAIGFQTRPRPSSIGARKRSETRATG